jgi:hypothetical protein
MLTLRKNWYRIFIRRSTGLNEFKTMRDLLTEEELAELIPPLREAADLSQQPTLEDRSSLMEQTFKYWEQTVHDLQMEVRELRNRIDRLERREEGVKPRKLPVIIEKEPDLAPDERLSRTERHRSHRGRLF